jgi:hypothetical protein
MKRHLRREVAREASMMSVLAIVAIMAIAWWWFADRPSPFSGGDPQSQALREYVEAAKRGDCARVIAALSRRSRELAAIVVAGRSTVERNFCDYSPATADLSDFETDRIRRESVAGPIAYVSASYTYERFFGFFGRGRNRYTYRLVSEDGRWRIDLSENLDPASRPNQDRHAMFLVQQAYMAISDERRETGALTSDPEVIRGQLPGFKFPDIHQGVAAASAPADTLFVTTGPSVACVSLRSASGTLVMLKIPQGSGRGTYQYGKSIPDRCDDQPLSRPYYGASSGIDGRTAQ